MPLTKDQPTTKEILLHELDNLFDATTPKRLRQSIQTMLFQFLQDPNNRQYQNISDMMKDIQYLIEFLEEIDNLNKKSGHSP